MQNRMKLRNHGKRKLIEMDYITIARSYVCIRTASFERDTMTMA